MPNAINDLFQQIIEILNNAEQQYRTTYLNALAISDIDEFQKTTMNAKKNFSLIMDWRSRIESIGMEIRTENILDDTTANPLYIDLYKPNNGGMSVLINIAKNENTVKDSQTLSFTMLGKVYDAKIGARCMPRYVKPWYCINPT